MTEHNESVKQTMVKKDDWFGSLGHGFIVLATIIFAGILVKLGFLMMKAVFLYALNGGFGFAFDFSKNILAQPLVTVFTLIGSVPFALFIVHRDVFPYHEHPHTVTGIILASAVSLCLFAIPFFFMTNPIF